MGSGHGFDRELLRLLRHRYGQSSRDDLIDFKKWWAAVVIHSNNSRALSASNCSTY
jgi:hypothetical protein